MSDPKPAKHRDATDWLPAERPRSARETLQGRIVALVRAGTCPQVAAAAVGVNRRTFRKWVERGGLKPGSREGRFVLALTEAEALLETLLVQRVVAQAKADAKEAGHSQASRSEGSSETN